MNQASTSGTGNPAELRPAHRILVLGGQKSGKSTYAEELAVDWHVQAPASHRAVLLATADARDEEMRLRIERHRNDRALRAPHLQTLETACGLARAIGDAGDEDTLRIVDCLTLWLTQMMFPAAEAAPANPDLIERKTADLLHAIDVCTGPLVLVSNEIGFGVIPLGTQTRAFVDALGLLNQRVAARCNQVVLTVAGQRLAIKDNSPCAPPNVHS